ncbi:MAG: hypothetical protein Q8Q50_06095 [Methylobacter sp.]|nr:hypothetical protein [Methylobacter sp.]
MAICATVDSVTNAFTANSTAIGSCTDYVIYTAADYALINPQITTSEAVELAWLVVGVWVVAWSIKQLKKVFF